MRDHDQINPLSDKDRQLLCDLSETFDLGTQSLLGQHEDEIIDELSDLMEEVESL
tara:strand:+ start:4708 stop:4872 length:165 start_codon:yes stop_codon:yes gene_type:complete